MLGPVWRRIQGVPPAAGTGTAGPAPGTVEPGSDAGSAAAGMASSEALAAGSLLGDGRAARACGSKVTGSTAPAPTAKRGPLPAPVLGWGSWVTNRVVAPIGACTRVPLTGRGTAPATVSARALLDLGTGPSYRSAWVQPGFARRLVP